MSAWCGKGGDAGWYGGVGGDGSRKGERGREPRRQSSPQSPLVLFMCSRFRTRLSRSLELTMRVLNFVDWQFFWYFTVTIFCDCSSLNFLTGTLINFRYCKQLRTRFFRLWESRYRRTENAVDYRVLSIHYYYVYLSLNMWSIVPVTEGWCNSCQ